MQSRSQFTRRADFAQRESRIDPKSASTAAAVISEGKVYADAWDEAGVGVAESTA